jgi:uncharacterized protein YraI
MKRLFYTLLACCAIQIAYATDFAVVNIAPNDTLSVRQGAGTQFAKVGQIAAGGLGIQVTGDEKQVMMNNGYSFWKPIRYEHLTGWVNSTYLVHQRGKAPSLVGQTAYKVLDALKNCSTHKLSTLTHPLKGVRFSLSDNEFSAKDLTFSATQIRQTLSTQQTYQWGVTQGHRIDMSFKRLCQQALQPPPLIQALEVSKTTSDQGFSNAQILNYLDAEMTEGEGAGLKVILERYKEQWYLVGLIPWSSL